MTIKAVSHHGFLNFDNKLGCLDVFKVYFWVVLTLRP